MTNRDREIIKWIEENKSMTIYQCSKIFFRDCSCDYDLARKRLRKLYEEGLIKRYRKRLEDEVVYFTEKKLKTHDLKLMDVIAYLQKFNIDSFEKEQKIEINSTINYIIDSTIVLNYKNLAIPILVEIDYTHYTSKEKIQDLIRYLEKKHDSSFIFIIVKFSQEEFTVTKSGRYSRIYTLNWNFQKEDKAAGSLRSLFDSIRA